MKATAFAVPATTGSLIFGVPLAELPIVPVACGVVAMIAGKLLFKNKESTLTVIQDVSLTVLLLMFTVLAVLGEFEVTSGPLGSGSATFVGFLFGAGGMRTLEILLRAGLGFLEHMAKAYLDSRQPPGDNGGS